MDKMTVSQIPFTFKIYFIIENGIKFVNKKIGITVSMDRIYFTVLLLIFFKPTINQHKVSLNLGIDKTTMSRIILKLEKLGLVIKEQDQKNKRSNILKVTQKGNDWAVSLNEYVYEYREKLIKGVDPETLKYTRKLIDLAVQNSIALDGDDYFKF